MIRALFTAIAALALAIGAALWFEDGEVGDRTVDDRMAGGGEDDLVTATAEPAFAVDPAPAVRAEEGPAVARSGESETKWSLLGEDAGDGGGGSVERHDPAPMESESPSVLETVDLGRPDFGPAPAPSDEPTDRPRLAVAPVDPERSAALIRRMLALYEVVRE